MKHTIKAILAACALFATLAFVAGCAQEQTPYEINDGEDYTVSVKYDANGGIFTTNTSVIVDSYNISAMTAGSSGKVEIALLSLDNSLRGNDAFTAINNGCFLAGWYAQRTETLDEQGNTVYVYADKWDFETDLLSVDTHGSYSSAEPVLTLYAAWIPLFEIEFYSLDSGEYLDTLTFNPMETDEILVPAWNTETGTINMYDFPKKTGYTFDGAYYDAAGTQKVDTPAVEHPGVVDHVNGMGKNSSMKLYVDWTEGSWYHIYNVDQFLENASVSGNYVIHEDLDFTGKIWPTSLVYGNFTGTVQGNGHVFRNIEVAQTNNSKVNAGLFGNLTETACLSDLTFENVSFTISAGSRVAGASYGLFAGTISGSAVCENVKIENSTLKIDSGCHFSTEDYAIGLLCGAGNENAVDYSGITCEAAGEKPGTVVISVDGNAVTVQFVSE